MATHAVVTYQLDPFWDNEYQTLDYIHEPFNDPDDVVAWIQQGYQPKICGDMCDMRSPHPSWNHRIIAHFESLGWKNIGTSYYRMTSGTVMPVHQDRYVKYIDLFNLKGQEHLIRRAIVMLEPWAPGHYLEVQGEPYVKWPAGFCVEWTYDIPHMAANVGLAPRYTLQVTGHL
jgi:hypothetical protein